MRTAVSVVMPPAVAGRSVSPAVQSTAGAAGCCMAADTDGGGTAVASGGGAGPSAGAPPSGEPQAATSRAAATMRGTRLRRSVQCMAVPSGADVVVVVTDTARRATGNVVPRAAPAPRHPERIRRSRWGSDPKMDERRIPARSRLWPHVARHAIFARRRKPGLHALTREDPVRSILGLFAKSPFGPLAEHTQRVHDTVVLLRPLMEAFIEGDWARTQEIYERISRLEHDADVIKNDIRDHLPKSLFLPVDRGDVL